MSQTRAADNFTTIRARLEELRPYCLSSATPVPHYPTNKSTALSSECGETTLPVPRWVPRPDPSSSSPLRCNQCWRKPRPRSTWRPPATSGRSKSAPRCCASGLAEIENASLSLAAYGARRSHPV